MAKCVSKEQLERYAASELPEADSAAIEAHLESCLRCAQALARQPGGDELLRRIRDLERSRTDIRPALERLRKTEEKITSTLFGKSP